MPVWRGLAPSAPEPQGDPPARAHDPLAAGAGGLRRLRGRGVRVGFECFEAASDGRAQYIRTGHPNAGLGDDASVAEPVSTRRPLLRKSKGDLLVVAARRSGHTAL